MKEPFNQKENFMKSVVISLRAWRIASAERMRRRKEGVIMSLGAIISELIIKSFPDEGPEEGQERQMGGP